MHKSIFLSLAAASSAFAAPYSCKSAPPVECNPDTCRPCFCLGPDEMITNAPVNPRTCSGDVTITVAGLYWRADQDGMEYAVENTVDSLNFIDQSNNLIKAEYKTPKSKWEGGARVALSYSSAIDGWDIGLTWTYFDGQASSLNQTQQTDNTVLLPLWSAFQGFQETGDFQGNTATEIKADWDVDFYLLDLELGRSYWTSRYLSMRPFIALRYVDIQQDFSITHSGGSWSDDMQDPLNDLVDLDNDFKGVGPRIGFDLNWNFGCGWSLYSELAASIIYGRFSVDHDEDVRQAVSPFSKGAVLENSYRFHASRAIVDLGLGVQYATLIADSAYGITVQLGWEQHLFFHQNQMWRVNRIGKGDSQASFRENSGENDFTQRRGTLSTHGWTLTFKFDF